MRFFSRVKTNVNAGEIWGMFADMGTETYRNRAAKSDTYYSRKYGHTLEVLSAAQTSRSKYGSAKMDQSSFDLAAYEARCYTNDTRSPDFYRDLHIAMEGDVDEYGQIPAGTVQMKDLPKREVFSFSTIENSTSIRDGIKYLMEHRVPLQRDVGVDPIISLLASLDGDEEATANVVKLTNHTEELKDIITDILTSTDIDDLQDYTLYERVQNEVDKYNA